MDHGNLREKLGDEDEDVEVEGDRGSDGIGGPPSPL